MIHVSLKKQLIIITTLIVVALFLISIFVIRPSVKETLILEKDINSIQTYLEKQYQRSQRLRKSVKKIDEVMELADAYTGSTIPKGNELFLITQLEKLSTDHNIDQNLTVLEIDEDIGEDTPAALRGKSYYLFSFVNHGKFNNHVAFLRSLEKLSYYLIIDNLNWENQNLGNTKIQQTTLRFDAKIYIEA
jgi:hypothetical protein